MNALRDKARAAAEAVAAKASAASDVIAAKASAASEVAIERAKKEAKSTREYVQAKAEEIKPKLQAAMASAEPSLQDFMKNPQVKYLKENPEAIAAVCGILVFVGIPGAASVSALVSLLGPIEMLLPMVMMMAGPVAEMMAGAATAV